MNSISVTYALIYRFKEAHEYKVSKCGKVFNTKTNRQIRKVVNSRCVGWWIKNKFISQSCRVKHLERIPRIKTPF